MKMKTYSVLNNYSYSASWTGLYSDEWKATVNC